MALALESTGARMSRLGASVLNELPILSIEELIARIDAVDIAAVRELSRETLPPAQLSVAGVGPDEASFRAAIEPLDGATGAREDRAAADPGPLAAQAARR
jgi:hypothetical protein